MVEFNRTTFVIGAGASVDFGFPTGNNLIQTISWLADALARDTLFGTEYRHSFFQVFRGAAQSKFNSSSPARLSDLALRVRDGLWLSASIDNFLNEQEDEDVARLGKFLIVSAILLHERYKFPLENQRIEGLFSSENSLWNSLIRPDNSRRAGFAPLRSSWLVPFFRLIRGRGGVEQFNERIKKLTLIIFNYDRSVEFFLHRALMTYDQLRFEEAAEVLNAMQIIHPYGVAAELDFQNPIEGVNYGNIEDNILREVLSRKTNIQTFAERSAGYDGEDAKDAIRHSRDLIFMGFGFLDQNLRYLGHEADLSGGPIQSRKVYATTFGLSDFQRHKSLEKIKGFQFAGTNITLKSHYNDVDRINHLNGTSSDLINEYGSEWFTP